MTVPTIDRSSAMAEMGIEDGFISHSVNVRFDDGLALGLFISVK